MDPTSYTRPDGCNDYDEHATARRGAIEARLLDLFGCYGYRQITVPTLEYGDLYSSRRIGSDPFHRLLSCRISESALFPAAEADASEAGLQGHRLSEAVLRPEFTAPVARWLVSRLAAGDEPTYLPARLAYAGQTFRNVAPGPERLKEFRQLGLELIGSDRAWGDLEILCVACDAAAALQLPGWRLHLGHARLYREILRTYGLAGETLVQVANNVEIAARVALKVRLETDDESLLAYVRTFLRIHRSRFPAGQPEVDDPQRLTAAEWRAALPALHDAYLRHLWAGPAFGLPAATIDDLLALARLGGEAEDFFSQLEPFINRVATDRVATDRGDGGEARKSATELRWLCTRLEQEKGVRPILSSAASRSLAYYTGLTFEIHCPIRTSPYTAVCGGGRYDELHRRIYHRALETQKLRGEASAPEADVEGLLNGVGLAFSVDRLTWALAAGEATATPGAEVFVAVLDPDLHGEAFAFAADLRRRGVAAECHLPATGASLAAAEQLDHAERLGSRFAVLFERQPWRGGHVGLRDMTTRRQAATAPEAALADIVAALGGKGS